MKNYLELLGKFLEIIHDDNLYLKFDPNEVSGDDGPVVTNPDYFIEQAAAKVSDLHKTVRDAIEELEIIVGNATDDPNSPSYRRRLELMYELDGYIDDWTSNAHYNFEKRRIDGVSPFLQKDVLKIKESETILAEFFLLEHGLKLEHNYFIKVHDKWIIWFEKTGVVITADYVGLRHIQYLVGHPGQFVLAEDLQHAKDGPLAEGNIFDNEKTTPKPFVVNKDRDQDDNKYISRIKHEINKYDAEIEVCLNNLELVRAEELKEKKKLLEKYINESKDRSQTPASKSVPKAIGDSLEKIHDHFPRLYEHLNTRIITGGTLCYAPHGPVVKWITNA